MEWYRRTALVGALALLAGSLHAAGQERTEFGQADQNGDGLISFDEAERALGLDEKSFGAADYDADDRLSAREFEQVRTLQVVVPEAESPTDEEATEPRLEIGRTPPRATPLMARTVDDVTGLEVQTATGEALGEVERIVVDPATNRLYAVVDTGGVAGIGSKKVLMDLEQMQLRDEVLFTAQVRSAQQLDLREEYDAARFQELENDQVLGQAARGLSTAPPR